MGRKNLVDGPLKLFGSKAGNGLAKQYASLYPPCKHRVDCCFGAGALTLAANPSGVSEVANDIDGVLYRFWRVLQNPVMFEQFKRLVEATPVSEPQWRDSKILVSQERLLLDTAYESPMVNTAHQFFIFCRQSLAGRMKSFTSISRNRLRRNTNEQASAWWSAVDGLEEVRDRLKNVVILNQDLIRIIESQDGPDTFFVIDPPYLHETRTSKDIYPHEMTDEQHDKLLDTLTRVRGKFLLCGYWSSKYDRVAKSCGWHSREFHVNNSSAGGKKKSVRSEWIWTNYELPPA